MADLTKLGLRKLSEPDEELLSVLDPNAPPARYPEIREGREMMLKRDMQAASLMRSAAVVESTIMVTMRDGYESELRCFKPAVLPPSGAPLVILYFGGGFMFGNNYQCANYATALADLCSAVVVLPSYRLAPEYPFPTGPNDAWDSFVWISANAQSLGASPSLGFIVGGRSAGGTLAAVIAQKALSDRFQGPKITGTWLSVPMLLSGLCVPSEDREYWISREQNKNAPFFNASMLKILMNTWKPDELSPLFSPFNAGPHAHLDMPTTYIQICGMDPLRDDAVLYDRALERKGVSTIVDIYPGLPHGVTTPLPHLKGSRKYQVDVVVRIGEMLGKSLDRQHVEKVFYWPPKAALNA